jgi:hypothetical protein
LIYDELDRISKEHPKSSLWFRQSDSSFNIEVLDGYGNMQSLKRKDKSFLFIEFLGQELDDDSAFRQCEEIAKIIGCQLQIL